ncbi:MAG TPA: hypothetical protein VIY29_07575 [Ktedonobacteraceae bacterium]
MQIFAYIILAFTFDEIIAIIGLMANVLQALVLPVTIFLLVVQTRAMRIQTTALVEQSKEMTAQTRVFIDTIYSATYQSLYDAEAHIGELMMTYPEASRILMSPKPQGAAEAGKSTSNEITDSLKAIDPSLRERVRWLGTAMLDFFEHIWTQSQKGGLPNDVWEAWEEYMGRMLSETRLRHIWQAERGYYSAGFQRFLDLKVGLAPETPVMPLLPRPMPTGGSGPLAAATAERRAGAEGPTPQVARVLRAVVEDSDEEK